MKRLIIISVALLWAGVWLMAQDTLTVGSGAEPVQEETPETHEQTGGKSQDWKQKIYYGGYINFSVGAYRLFGIEPMVGYKIIPALSVGAKFRYDYISDRRYQTTYTYSNYGGSVFTRLRVFKPIYLHAEYAFYNYESYNLLGESDRDWVPFLLVGGGLSQQIGPRTSVNVQVLFDVLHSDKSPYNDWEPFFSVGVGVGF